MSYKLEKPYTDIEKSDFICKYHLDTLNEGYNCHIEETETALFALEENEILVDGEPQVDPDYEEKQKQEQEKEFNRKFFNTSLGYVSRDVHMKNGTVKDFLTDILPLLKEGIPVITYTRQLEQHTIPATAQFIEECGQQLMADFYGEDN